MRPDVPTFRARAAICGALFSLAASPLPVRAQADEPVLRARALDATASIKMFVSAGSLRLIAWDRDSIVVRGHVPRGEQFFFSGDARGMKLGMLDHADNTPSPPSTLVVYLPRRAQLSIKSVSADVAGNDVSGWFYSVSGTIHLSGSATSVDAEAMSGDVTLDVSAPWVHARTGGGHLLVRGAPQDADISTISGALDIASPAIMRGRFASVSGDIRYVGAPPAGGIFEFSNHAGSVDLALPTTVAGTFDLSTISGDIENGLSPLRPVAESGGRGRSLRLNLGRDGGRVTVRTFKGTIRLRPQ
jgi:hypothetical protein